MPESTDEDGQKTHPEKGNSGILDRWGKGREKPTNVVSKGRRGHSGYLGKLDLNTTVDGGVVKRVMKKRKTLRSLDMDSIRQSRRCFGPVGRVERTTKNRNLGGAEQKRKKTTGRRKNVLIPPGERKVIRALADSTTP